MLILNDSNVVIHFRRYWLKGNSSTSLKQNKEWSQSIDYSLITLLRMFRQCSELSVKVQMFRYYSEFSGISDNVQTLFSQSSEFVQNFQSMFRMLRICSDFYSISSTKTGLFRIFWLCSDSNQQWRECGAFVVKKTNTVVTLDKLVFSPYTPITATIKANKNDN